MTNLINLVQDPQTGMFLFVNGEKAFFPEMRFAPEPEGPWESKFNPYVHAHENLSTLEVQGHKWIQLRVNELQEWSAPARFIGKDGKSVTLRVYDKVIMAKFDGEQEFALFDMTQLTGPQGIPGPAGAGCAIQQALFYDEMLLLNPTPASSCNTCGGGHSHAGLMTVLVLGDNRNHKIVDADWAGEQYHKVDAVSPWVRTTGLDFGTSVRFYGYNGTGTATIKDATLENTLGFADTVWVNSEGIWHKIASIAQPTYKVAPNAGNANRGAFLHDYIVNSETIELIGGFVMEVKLDAIAAKHLAPGTFTFGFDEGIGTVPIRIKPSDFAGYGLSTYINEDGDLMLQVLPSTFIGDGLSFMLGTSLDNEVHQVQIVNVEDLVSAVDNCGLSAYVSPADNKKNLKVNTNKAMFLFENKLNVRTDEFTLTQAVPTLPAPVDNPATPLVNEALIPNPTLEISVMLAESDDLLKGVQGKHIHKNAYNELKGIKKVSNQAELLINAQQFEFDGAGELNINDDGIRANKIHSSAIGKGLRINEVAVSEDPAEGTVKLLEAMPDETSITFDANGKLKVKELTAAQIPAGTLVDSINVNAQGAIKGAVAINIAGAAQEIVPAEGAVPATTETVVNVAANLNSNLFTVNLTLNRTGLDHLIEALGYIKEANITDIPWGTLKQTTESNSDTIASYVNKTAVIVGTTYGDTRITSSGLQMRNSNGDWYDLFLDQFGYVGSTPAAQPQP